MAFSIASFTCKLLFQVSVSGQNLGGNTIEETGAKALGEMLKTNIWMTHLNLSGKAA